MCLAGWQAITAIVGALGRLATNVCRDDQAWIGDRTNRTFAAVVLQHLKPKLLLSGSHLDLPQTTLLIIGQGEGRVRSRSRDVGWRCLSKQDQKLLGVVVPVFNPT